MSLDECLYALMSGWKGSSVNLMKTLGLKGSLSLCEDISLGG